MRRLLRKTILAIQISVLFFLSSCGGEEAAVPVPNDPAFEAFAKLPYRQYFDLTLGMETSLADSLLREMGYEHRQEGETVHFEHPTDSVDVFLPLAPELYTFKVFLKSTEYMNRQDELMEVLGKNQSYSKVGDSFSEYHYETDEMTYSLTVFVQEESIRLKYTLETRRG